MRASVILIPAILALPAQSFAVSPEEQATKLYKEATKALNNGRDEEAAAKLRQAFRLHRVHDYVCNLGSLELTLGRGPKAAEALFTCTQVLPSKEEAMRPTIERLLARAKALSGTLRINSNVAEADVLMNGTSIGKTPLNAPAFVDPGRHLVEVRAPGYEPEVRIVDLRAGSDLELDLPLEPAELTAPPLPAKTGTPIPPKATEKAPSPQPLPRPAPSGLNVRPGFLLAGIGVSLTGAAVAAGALVAASAATREAKAVNEANLADKTCTSPESKERCIDLSGRIDEAVGFTAAGVAGIGLAVIGGGLIAYEFLRADAQKNVPVCAALVAAPNRGMLTFKGAW